MAKQKILWPVLPNGYGKPGRLRASIVVSPRLTPESANEQTLGAFDEWLDWPRTLSNMSFEVEINGQALEVKVATNPDSDLWRSVFPTDTFVEGFQFKDMSLPRLHSYQVRAIMNFTRRHYGTLAAAPAPDKLPQLLPFDQADSALTNMLGELGIDRSTVMREFERAYNAERPHAPIHSGFERFFGSKEQRDKLDQTINRQLFGAEADLNAPIAARKPRAFNPNSSNYPTSLFATRAEFDFYQANRFYSRVENKPDYLRYPDRTQVPPPPAQPKFDFHRKVAALADMPQILRALGLIIDIEFKTPAPFPLGTMRLLPKLLPNHVLNQTDVTPVVAISLYADRFTMRARNSEEIERGQLRLTDTNDRYANEKHLFDLSQVDPDGAALKTVNQTISLLRTLVQRLPAQMQESSPDSVIYAQAAYTTPNDTGLAALRSGGLALSRHGRALRTAQQSLNAAQLNQQIESNATPAPLFAEDVLRGYRVDIDDGNWRSLMQRVGSYRLQDGTPIAMPEEVDEGYVKGASTTSNENDDNNHYLHETLFKWNGWSLAVPRPGRTLVPVADADNAAQGERVTEVKDEAKQGSGIIAQFRVAPGSLPRLRFGRGYRMRARCVDLAGNSINIKEGDDNYASERVRYQRFEPLDPPVVVLDAKVSEGESIEHLVVRSNFDSDPAAYLQTEPFSSTREDFFEYRDFAARHFAPPKTSQLMAETHGAFDAAIGQPANSAQVQEGYDIAAREAGSLQDVTSGQVELVTPPSARGVTKADLPIAAPSETNPSGDRLSGGQYFVHREAQLVVPYLPDVAAGGVVFRGLPGVSAEGALGEGARIERLPNQELVLIVDYDQAWPDARGLRLHVVERGAALDASVCAEAFADDGAPSWDAQARVLTVFLAKGRIARVRYASVPRKDTLDHFGVLDWIENAAQRDNAWRYALAGSHWMIAPHRDLTLTHATQQPVCAPQFLLIATSRAMGATNARLRTQVRLHGPSTGQVEVLGEWSEWIDDLAEPAPRRIAASVRLAPVRLPENFKNVFDLGEIAAPNGLADKQVRGDVHEFGDTKFRLIRYRLVATTRFREFFPVKLTDEVKNLIREGDPFDGINVKFGSGDDPGAPVLPDAGAAKFGVMVRASARPVAPKIQYVLPTFGWSRQFPAADGSYVSSRRGGGLRVYLERPWFSSGDGELLGVALPTQAMAQLPNTAKPFVTLWGVDPLFNSGITANWPRPTAFPRGVYSEHNVWLEEFGANVDIAGHRVEWDGANRRWFCDIDISLASYFPFVRLALVRYQPNALAQARISQVALAEFAQVAPHRNLYVQPAADGTALGVKVYGLAPETGSVKAPQGEQIWIGLSFSPSIPTGDAHKNRIEAVLQTRDAQIDSDLAWHDVPGTAVWADATPQGGAPSVLTPVTDLGVALGATSVASPRLEETGVFAVAGTAPSRPTLLAGVVLGAAGGVTAAQVEITPGASAQLAPIFDRSVAIPANLADQPLRLMVREYERYYSDRIERANLGGTPHDRIAVDERLVYAEIIPLRGS